MGDVCCTMLTPEMEVDLEGVDSVPHVEPSDDGLFLDVEYSDEEKEKPPRPKSSIPVLAPQPAAPSDAGTDLKCLSPILEKIASYLPMSDLKSLRHTSRKWNKCFQDEYFQKSCVSFEYSSLVNWYCNGVDPDVHSKFVLHSNKFEGDAETSGILARFFRKYGPQISHLDFHFKIKTSGDVTELQRLLANLSNTRVLELHLHFWTRTFPFPLHLQFDLHTCPVLKTVESLRIVLHRDCDYFLGRNVLLQLANLAPSVNFATLAPLAWKLAPDVKDLKINTFFVDADRSFHDALFEDWNENTRLLQNLQEIHMYGLPGTPKQLLTAIKTPLKKLTILFDKSKEFTWLDLLALFHRHSMSLEVLTLRVTTDCVVMPQPQTHLPGHQPGRSGRKYRIGLEFPNKMPTLRKLQVAFVPHWMAGEDLVTEFPMDPMDYGRTFPNLEVLSLTAAASAISNAKKRDYFQDVVFQKMLPNVADSLGPLPVAIGKSLKKLELEYDGDSGIVPELEKKVMRLFPNACKDGLPPPLKESGDYEWSWKI